MHIGIPKIKYMQTIHTTALWKMAPLIMHYDGALEPGTLRSPACFTARWLRPEQVTPHLQDLAASLSSPRK